MGLAWADSMRFALIDSLIVSLAGSYVPALVVQAVRTGLWSVERGYSVGRRVPDPVTAATFGGDCYASVPRRGTYSRNTGSCAGGGAGHQG